MGGKLLPLLFSTLLLGAHSQQPPDHRETPTQVVPDVGLSFLMGISQSVTKEKQSEVAEEDPVEQPAKEQGPSQHLDVEQVPVWVPTEEQGPPQRLDVKQAPVGVPTEEQHVPPKIGPNSIKGREVSCQVLILGAGMAGITAAQTLKDLGITDLKIVEGGDRIGGRIKDVEFGGINVELGANWVQFSNMDENTVNPVETLVREAGLNIIEDNYKDFIFRYKGTNVTAESYTIQEQLDEVIEASIGIAQRKEQNGEPDVNYRVALALADWRPKTPLAQAVEFFTFDFEFGDEPADTSLMDNYKAFSHHGKDDLFVSDKRGYSHIIKKMAENLELQENENLFLNDYVTKINYAEPGDKKVRVVAKNSVDGLVNVYRADYVITTFSIGVLESDYVEFVPRLPPWKEEIIYMYKMIRYIKIFVKFPESTKAFWDDNHYIMYVDPTIRGNYQIWQNLEARGKYFPRGTNMLLITVIGQNWERVKFLSKDEVRAELFQVLKNMYGDAAVEPEDILIPDWHTNPLFFGAYSNWPIGVSNITYQNLDAPVGRLYFAGEACSPNFAGFVHGAMESGELTARNMYLCMVDNDNCEQVPGNGYGYNNGCRRR